MSENATATEREEYWKVLERFVAWCRDRKTNMPCELTKMLLKRMDGTTQAEKLESDSNVSPKRRSDFGTKRKSFKLSPEGRAKLARTMTTTNAKRWSK